MLTFCSPKIQLQYVVTEVAGTLNVLDGVPVFPKALESIVVIDGWPYESLDNTLTLKLAIGSAESSWSSGTALHLLKVSL